MDAPAKVVPFSQIFTPGVLAVIREAGFDVAELCGQSGAPDAMKWYPDGSLQIDGADAVTRFIHRCDAVYAKRADDINEERDPLCSTSVLGDVMYESLAAFPERLYTISIWGDFVRELEGSGIGVSTARASQRGTRPLPEWPISDLMVSVAFRKRLSKDHRQQFAVAVRGWLDSVRKRGMFDEGPVRPVADEIAFSRRLAQFRIDASESGQNTINWMLLSLLPLCEANPITLVYFVMSFLEYRLEPRPHYVLVGYQDVYGPVEHRLSLSDVNRHREATALRDEHPATPAAPGDRTPYPGWDSDSFLILMSPHWIPAASKITVQFEQLPHGENQRAFAAVLESWLLLGQNGGFGGRGFGSYGRVHFSRDRESATFQCDMGMADAERALDVLFSALECWHLTDAISAVYLDSTAE